MIPYPSSKSEQYRVGQPDTSGPMDVDNVSGSEKDNEDWENVDEIRRSMRCCNCGLMGHSFAVAKRSMTTREEKEHRLDEFANMLDSYIEQLSRLAG